MLFLLAMESKKKFAINGIAQIFSFLVSIGITFFLTPYIVSRLGAAAYGFVGLASNFVSYAQIATIALNSMAGRFITISVHQNDIEKARKYFSSVFYSNIILVAFISIIGIAVLYKLEHIIDIPTDNLYDVKVLFGCIFLNFFISIIFNVYNVCTFIRNRLDLSSSRTIIANAQGHFSRRNLLLFRPGSLVHRPCNSHQHNLHYHNQHSFPAQTYTGSYHRVQIF